ncbi:MAG: hypothetical protein J6Z45_01945, partial [Oscillospiraceae bacterium]|nr:hypothetical protein [Oscillospiraceae bacterium]
HSLILSDCSLSKSGDRALLRLEGRYYLCDLSGLGPDSRITAEEVKDAEKAFFSGDYSITVKSRTGDYGKLVLAADDTVITSMGMSFFDDQANEAIYFTEQFDGRISLCRWQDGKTVRIADGITFITSDSPTLLFDNPTGNFAFVMAEEGASGKQYTIYTGNIESSSVEDCRAVWSGTNSPVLCNAYSDLLI